VGYAIGAAMMLVGGVAQAIWAVAAGGLRRWRCTSTSDPPAY